MVGFIPQIKFTRNQHVEYFTFLGFFVLQNQVTYCWPWFRFIAHIYVHICKMAEHAPWSPGLDTHFFALPTDVLSFKTQASPCAVQEHKIKYTQRHSHLSQRTQEAATLWKQAAFEGLQSPEREWVSSSPTKFYGLNRRTFFVGSCLLLHSHYSYYFHEGSWCCEGVKK